MKTVVKTAAKTAAKMSGEARREAIVRAVRAVFAEKGSHGCTTRELAQAAGVSEALLFKHFPNKDALYAAMIQSCVQDRDHEVIGRLMALEPSTATLVLHVHLMLSHFIGGPQPSDDHDLVLVRLLQRSMMEDGDYARLLHRRLGLPMMEKLERSIDAAIAAGDAIAGPSRSMLSAWFTQHVAMTVMFHLLPETPIIDYHLSRRELVEQAVWFSLRGMGVKEEAIRRHFHPEAAKQFVAEAKCHAVTNGKGRGKTNGKPTANGHAANGHTGGMNGHTNGQRRVVPAGAAKRNSKRIAVQGNETL